MSLLEEFIECDKQISNICNLLNYKVKVKYYV